MSAGFDKVAQLKSVAALRERVAELGLDLPVDERVLSAAEGSPLAESPDGRANPQQTLADLSRHLGWDVTREARPQAKRGA